MDFTINASPSLVAKEAAVRAKRSERLALANQGNGGLIFAADLRFPRNHWGYKHGDDIDLEKADYFSTLTDLELYLIDRGMKLVKAVTNKVDFLIVENESTFNHRKDNTSKMIKARDLGIPIITEKELLERHQIWPVQERKGRQNDEKIMIVTKNDLLKPDFYKDSESVTRLKEIKLSALSIARLSMKTIAKLLPNPDSGLASKIIITDTAKVTNREQRYIAMRYIYGTLALRTLKPFLEVMKNTSDAVDALGEIITIGALNPIGDDVEISEAGLKSLKPTGFLQEIAEEGHKLLFHGEALNLCYAQSGNPVDDLTIVILLLSLARKPVTVGDWKYQYNWDAFLDMEIVCKYSYQTLSSPEMQFLNLIDRNGLRNVIGKYMGVVSEKLVILPEIFRILAGKLCDPAQAQLMLKQRENYIIQYLAWNEYADTLLAVDKGKRFHTFADIRGISIEKLRRSLIAQIDLGLDAEGCMMLDYGSRVIRAELQPNLDFNFTDMSRGRRTSTLPKTTKADDPEKAASAQSAFKTTQNYILSLKESFMNQVRDMLENGKLLPLRQWRQMFFESQVGSCVAQGILWGVYKKGDELIQPFFVRNNQYLDAIGATVSITKNAMIGIVDMAQVAPAQRQIWRQCFDKETHPQPVEQVWRPVTLLSLDVLKRRYENCKVTIGILKSQGYNPYGDDSFTLFYGEITMETEPDNRLANQDRWIKNIYISMADVTKLSCHEKRMWNQSIRQADRALLGKNGISYSIDDVIETGIVEEFVDWISLYPTSPETLHRMIKKSTEVGNVEVTALLLEAKHTAEALADDLIL